MRSTTGDFATRAVRSLLAVCVVSGMLAACSCDRFSESYAPPVQHMNFVDGDRWERVIHMTDVDAPVHFVADIVDPLAANWRWTGQRPTVHLTVPAQERLRYYIEFVIPRETFSSTGPVKLTFLVDGRALDVQRYAAAGSYEFKKDIPPEWISSGGDVRLGAEIDKVLTLKGRAYGFLLLAIGLTRD